MVGRRFFAVVAPLVAMGACSSIPELRFDDDGGRPDARPEGGLVDVTGVDAAGCIENPNCADPTCQAAGFACVPRAPGWRLVAVSDTRAAECPPGADDKTDLEMVVGNAATCECACTDADGTCTGGTTTLTVSTEAACAGGTTLTRELNRRAENCTAIPDGGVVVETQRNRMATGSLQPTACNKTVAVTLAARLAGRTCRLPTKESSEGCRPDEVCAPAAFVAGWAVCAAQDGRATCINPYTNERRAGTSITSTPTCDVSGCECKNDPCSGKLTVYNNATCATGGANRFEDIPTADAGAGACAPFGGAGGPWGTALSYKAAAAGGCATTGAAPQPQGTIELAGEQTICCADRR